MPALAIRHESAQEYNRAMIRIREIDDPDLREKIVRALAGRRGMAPAAIPDWFELDDADYVDLLMDLREEDQMQREHREYYDPRM